jgi:Flp pilus assembly pilin Flp
MAGMEGSRQAMGCAAYIRDGRIIGAYGSRVLDMEEADLTGGAEHDLTHGEICDDCIEGLMKTGKLIAGRDTGEEGAGVASRPAPPDKPTARTSFLMLPCFSASQYGGIAMEYALIGALVSITLIPGLLVADVGKLFNTTSAVFGSSVTEALPAAPSDSTDSTGPAYDPDHQVCDRPNPPQAICG